MISKMRKLLWISMLILITGIEKSLQAMNTKTLNNFRNYRHSYYTLEKNDWHHFLYSDLLGDLSWQIAMFFQNSEKHNTSVYEGLILEGNKIEILNNNFSNSITDISFLSLKNNSIQKIEEGVFNNLTKLVLLLLEDNKLQELSSGIFSHLESLRFLKIDGNNLRTLSADIFVNNFNLKTISLNGNSFRSLPEGLFKNNKNLEEVNLQHVSTLTSLPSGLFSNKTSLQFVHLNNCNLTILPENLFQGSINIFIIYLNNNALKNLPAKLFQGLENLKLLKLNENQLQILSDDLFHSCSSMTELFLNRNNLVTINWSIFMGLHSLTTLYLDHNKITNFVTDTFVPSLSINFIILSHNNISDSDPNSSFFLQSLFSKYQNLEFLDLSHNKLQLVSKDWFKRLPPNFFSLNLAHNAITSLTGDDLNIEHEQILLLTLSNNNITEIDLQNYKESRHKIKLNIENNPLDCNCHLYDVLRYSNESLNKLEGRELEIVTGSSKCVGSNEYEDILISNINLEEYKCAPPKEEIDDYDLCPSECNLQKRPADNKLLVDCSNRNLTFAPENLCSLKGSNSSIKLNLTGNQIKDFPNFQKVGYDKVTSLLLSQNKISTLPEDAFFNPTLEILALDNNQLGTLSPNIIKKISSSIQSIQLGNNPWNCNCGTLDFQKLILMENLVADVDSINCQNSNLLLKNLHVNDLCPIGNFSIILVGATLSVLSFLCYSYRDQIRFWLYVNNLCMWFFAEEDLEPDKLYDAFISYCYEDEEFVVKELVTNLENGPRSFKLCLRFRDWLAGGWIPNQIIKSIQNSKRTIIVLSPNFLTNEWAKMELKASHKEALVDKKSRIIIVLYGDIGPIDELDPELQAYLKMNTFVKWGDPWFWDKLRYALPHKSDVLFKVSKPSNIKRPHPVSQLSFNTSEVTLFSRSVEISVCPTITRDGSVIIEMGDV